MGHDLRSSYDTLAEEYARRLFHELEQKPRDRELLDRLIREVGDGGPICDLGCGPGQVARYLTDHGADAVGVDLSERMIQVARRLSPTIRFHIGDMLSLDFPDRSWGGVAAFYSIIHIPDDRVVDALREIRRVLKPGGTLLIAFHIGCETRHFDDLWGHDVNMDFIFYPVEVIQAHLDAAGYQLRDTIVRDPDPDVEYPSRRAYLFAVTPPEVGKVGEAGED